MRDEYLKEAQKVITDPNILINVVSRRVKQLKFGMKPLVESLEKLVIIGNVIYVPPEIVRVEPEFAQEPLGQPNFVVVAMRRFHRQTQNVGIQGLHCRGARQENVLR